MTVIYFLGFWSTGWIGKVTQVLIMTFILTFMWRLLYLSHNFILFKETIEIEIVEIVKIKNAQIKDNHFTNVHANWS